MLLADFADYVATQARVDALYRDPAAWASRALVNVAAMGAFSSDRTIRDYVQKIWTAPPELTLVLPWTMAPLDSCSVPPLLTTVSLATPELVTASMPPSPTVVALVRPPDNTISVPPLTVTAMVRPPTETSSKPPLPIAGAYPAAAEMTALPPPPPPHGTGHTSGGDDLTEAAGDDAFDRDGTRAGHILRAAVAHRWRCRGHRADDRAAGELDDQAVAEPPAEMNHAIGLGSCCRSRCRRRITVSKPLADQAAAAVGRADLSPEPPLPIVLAHRRRPRASRSRR
jgi:hypothetical protein